MSVWHYLGRNGDAGDDDIIIIIISIIINNNNNINNSLHLLKTVKFTSLWAFQFYSKCLVFLNIYPDNRRPFFSDLLLAGNIGGILEGDPWTWASLRVKSDNRPNKGKDLAAGGTTCTHIPCQPKQHSHWLHPSGERAGNPTVTHSVLGKKAEYSGFGKKGRKKWNVTTV